MSKTSIMIGDAEIKPGQRKTILLPMPKLYDWTPICLPIHVINGPEEGPTLCVTAAIHGDEINGVEIIRRLLKKKGLKHINGSVIAIPIVNVYGFLYQERYLMDRRDLNRSFPGSSKGSLASLLAEIISKQILSQSTHAIDLHTGSNHRFNLPQIRANLDMEGIEDLARAFNVPVILHSTFRDGSMREYANEQGIHILVYEGGESLRFDELSIRTGINGILSVMGALGMIKPSKYGVKKCTPTVSRNSYWLRAPISGILRHIKKSGNKVTKGQVIAIIANPSSTEEYKLKSPISGIIIGESKLPLVHSGQALFHIASFEKLDVVAEQLENLQEAFDLNEYED
ncbi:succinylglutamate desuccinylase/aspartoacylase family protein [Legionella cincinnatiensis]|uniref:Succinylglutamate desuccinylase / aspartoacylase family n=1 Tax=Legionella cincinnatiensis TaxID=28085 RepID=A0A378IQB1_9GAMM|nr:succinylglutamate desuccinylase/aspartoacylase family protein [Legionella cincinnatiensis]KTC92324.1 succinylglutamate desuccinylase / aspartoacylase family protein [Legionella cincinnatiensis]STX36795.1 succinylglutamate desuccinylase / aspartoacylase family [Legionella cincinnatiensis]